MEGIWYPFFGNLSQSEKISEIKHGPLLLGHIVGRNMVQHHQNVSYNGTDIKDFL